MQMVNMTFGDEGKETYVLDFYKGSLVRYDGSKGFHEKYSGRCYYVTSFGSEGAGCIDAHTAVRVVSTYQTESLEFSAFDEMRSIGSIRVLPTREDTTIFLPLDNSKQVDCNFPVIIRERRKNSLVMLGVGNLLGYLMYGATAQCGSLYDGSPNDLSHLLGGGTFQTKSLKVECSENLTSKKTRDIIKAMCRHESIFQIKGESFIDFSVYLDGKEICHKEGDFEGLLSTFG